MWLILKATRHLERYVEVQNKVADDLVVHAGDDAKIRIIGGGVGEEVILKDEGMVSLSVVPEQESATRGRGG